MTNPELALRKWNALNFIENYRDKANQTRI